MTDDRHEGWSVVHESQLELHISDSLDLRFVAVTDGHRFSVHGLDDLIAVGSVRWLITDPKHDDDSGTITWIEVSPKHRRKGVATALLQAAGAYAKHYGLPRPCHADSQSIEQIVADGARLYSEIPPMTDDRHDSWPVVHESELELHVSDSLDLRFVAVTDGRRCSVHGLDDLIALGSVRWLITEPKHDDVSGTITWIEVSPKHRRKRVATALLQAARAYAKHYGLPRPRHSDSRTRLGEAWATAQGARRAEKVLEDWSGA